VLGQVMPLDPGAGCVGVAPRVSLVVAALDAPTAGRGGLVSLEQAAIGQFCATRRHAAILTILRFSVKATTVATGRVK
jgi:hypothetical protein